MAGPVHFFGNELGGVAHGAERGGLTRFGAAAILLPLASLQALTIVGVDEGTRVGNLGWSGWSGSTR